MSKESDFLLGIAFGLLSQVRQHLVQNGDRDGILLIEDEYLQLKSGIEKHYYGENK